MAEVTRDDVQRAVQDGLRDVKDSMQRVLASVQRVDQRTDDLDASQREISELRRLAPIIEDLNRRTVQEFDRLRLNSEDMKGRIQNMEQGIQRITEYLQAQSKAAGEEKGYKKE